MDVENSRERPTSGEYGLSLSGPLCRLRCPASGGCHRRPPSMRRLPLIVFFVDNLNCARARPSGCWFRYIKMVGSRLLRQYEETRSLLTDVRSAADADRAALGFLPETVYEQAAAEGRLWVAVDSEDKYVGHLLFGGTRLSLRVFQLAVSINSRRQGIATMMLAKLEEYGETHGYMSVLARVAADLPANPLWNRCGYPVLRQLPGAGPKPRTINLRGRQLRVPTLFGDNLSTPQQQPRISYIDRPLVSELIYVVDLNVLFDILKNRIGQYVAQRVITLALAGPYRLYVTSEAQNELSRTSIDPAADSALRFVRDLPALPHVATTETLPMMEQLTSIVHRGLHFTDLPPNEQSDLVHLSHSIHHRVRGFVTSDKKLLQANDAIRDRYGLEIVSPIDLTETHDPPSLYSATTGSHVVTTRYMTESERSRVERFLASLGVSPELSAEALQPMAGGSNRSRLIAATDVSIVAYASWDDVPSPNISAYFFADETFSQAPRVIDCVLAALTESLPFGRLVRIELQTLTEQNICRETALSRGYQSLPPSGAFHSSRLCKVSFRGPAYEESWIALAREFRQFTGLTLSSKMPPNAEFTNTGVLMQGRVDHIMPLFDFETLLSPIMLVCRRRTCVVVPIRLTFAESLLGFSNRQGKLFPEAEVALHSEKAYFRSPRGAGIVERGGIIIFYITADKKGGKQMVGSARATSTSVLAWEKALVDFSRQGVLSKTDLAKMADANGNIHAFTFDNITLFPRPLNLELLKKKKILRNQTLIRPFRLDAQATLRLFKLAYSPTP